MVLVPFESTQSNISDNRNNTSDKDDKSDTTPSIQEQLQNTGGPSGANAINRDESNFNSLNSGSNNSTNNRKRPKRIERDLDKIQKLLRIVLKIALYNGYNEDFNIHDSNGNIISDSDICTLLNYALTPQKVLIGENDFIRVLYESDVNPYWIVNENVRARLLNYRGPRNPPKDSPPPPSPTAPRPPTPLESQNTDSPMNQIETIPKQIIETHPERINLKRKLPMSEEAKKNEEEINAFMGDGPMDPERTAKEKKPWDTPLPDSDEDFE